MTDNLDSTDSGGPQAHDESGPDETLGGYLSLHSRSPAFQGSDGHPYTVSPEIEKTANLLAPYSGFLVFPKWAETGVGIVGHLETPILLEEKSSEATDSALQSLTLFQVQALLEDAIRDEQIETE